jgi:hypothetical protein
MPVNFRQRAEQLSAQLAEVKQQLEAATPDEKRRLTALAASIQRSLRWYTARAGSRSDVHALRVSVADEVHTTTGM